MNRLASILVVVASISAEAEAPRGSEGGGSGAAACPPTVHYYHHDAADNLWAVTDEIGTVVWRAEVHPFGQGVPDSSLAALRFVDQPRVADIGVLGGLHHTGRRTFDPLTGRYLTTDPLSLTRVPREEPQRFNRFAYGVNNPESFTDSTGWSPQARGKRESQDPIEARKVTKIPLFIIDNDGKTPLDLVLNPDQARKAILRRADREQPELPEAALRLFDADSLNLLLQNDPETRQLVRAAREQAEARQLRLVEPGLDIQPRPPLKLCDCDLEPKPTGEEN